MLKPFSKRRITKKAAQVSFNALQAASLYGFPAGDGAGQGIGIIELDGGYNQSDMVTYFAGLKLAVPQIVSVSIDGASNSPYGDPSSADGEVGLDIQIAGAIAPKAIIKVFFAPNSNQGFLDAITTALADPQITVLSISWGGPENTWGGDSVLAQFDAAFKVGGKLVFVASGDSGSGDGESGRNADFPGSSPNVISCGGTTLVGNAAFTQIVSEIVWNSDGGSSGGGVSSYFLLPAYQASANVPGGKYRGIPDLAANADPNTGFEVYIDGNPEIFGGTSCVAPLMAGLFARINSLNQAAGKPVLTAATVHPYLYSMGLPESTQSGFRDITSGNNGVYTATSGWDACTGLGSPKGTALLAGPTTVTPPPVVTPPPAPTPPPIVRTYNAWLAKFNAEVLKNPNNEQMRVWVRNNMPYAD